MYKQRHVVDDVCKQIKIIYLLSPGMTLPFPEHGLEQ